MLNCSIRAYQSALVTSRKVQFFLNTTQPLSRLGTGKDWLGLCLTGTQLLNHATAYKNGDTFGLIHYK